MQPAKYPVWLVSWFTLVTGRYTQQFLASSSEPRNGSCELLASKFGSQVAFPRDNNYNSGQALYWTAQQSELRPNCRFFPNSAEDIQEALSDVLIPHNVSFAVVSGGRSANQGASNIDAGVTVDLSNIADITLIDNNEAVMLGSGARWGDVYSKLDPYHLTVPGARSADVGVGGFVLGGGNSWLADRYGWACDSALEFEVITPNAEILRVSKAINEDLFWALKGSLGAFGIVTKIKMPTSKIGYAYAGGLSYDGESVPQVFNALQTINERAVDDPATQGYISMAWIEARKDFVYNAYLMNTEGNTSNERFDAFKAIRHNTHTLRMTTLSDSAQEIHASNPRGQRRTKFTLTCRSTTEIMTTLHELVQQHTSDIDFLRPDDILGVTFEPLTVPHLRRQEDDTGRRSNIFPLDASRGPLLIVSVEFWWRQAAQDEAFGSAARHLRSAMQAQMQALGVWHGWVYPAYANKQDQHPFAAPRSMNPSTERVLQRIRRKYDPEDVWRKLVPGIWHI